MPKINVSGLSSEKGDLGFTPLVPGTYMFECVDAQEGTSGSGNVQTILKLLVLDGPAQEDGSDPAQRQMTDFITLTDNEFTRKRLKNACDAFGVSVTRSDNIELNDFVGSRAGGVVVTDEYKGKVNNKIRMYIPEDEVEVGE